MPMCLPEDAGTVKKKGKEKPSRQQQQQQKTVSFTNEGGHGTLFSDKEPTDPSGVKGHLHPLLQKIIKDNNVSFSSVSRCSLDPTRSTNNRYNRAKQVFFSSAFCIFFF